MSLVQTGSNPEHMSAKFWVVCMEAQVWEMKEAFAHNDYSQLRKELADCALVSFDAIRLMGLGDAFNVILERSAGNLPKFTEEALKANPRDTDWYLAKIEKIKKELEQ